MSSSVERRLLKALLYDQLRLRDYFEYAMERIQLPKHMNEARLSEAQSQMGLDVLTSLLKESLEGEGKENGEGAAQGYPIDKAGLEVASGIPREKLMSVSVGAAWDVFSRISRNSLGFSTKERILLFSEEKFSPNWLHQNAQWLEGDYDGETVLGVGYHESNRYVPLDFTLRSRYADNAEGGDENYNDFFIKELDCAFESSFSPTLVIFQKWWCDPEAMRRLDHNRINMIGALAEGLPLSFTFEGKDLTVEEIFEQIKPENMEEVGRDNLLASADVFYGDEEVFELKLIYLKDAESPLGFKCLASTNMFLPDGKAKKYYHLLNKVKKENKEILNDLRVRELESVSFDPKMVNFFLFASLIRYFLLLYFKELGKKRRRMWTTVIKEDRKKSLKLQFIEAIKAMGQREAREASERLALSPKEYLDAYLNEALNSRVVKSMLRNLPNWSIIKNDGKELNAYPLSQEMVSEAEEIGKKAIEILEKKRGGCS